MIKLLARDTETGRIGTYQAAFTIPNLKREEKRAADQLRRPEQPARRAWATRCYTVKKARGRAGRNPLVFDGQKLMPSVTRVFSKSRDLYVFLQAYQRGRDQRCSRSSRSSASTAARRRRSRPRRCRRPRASIAKIEGGAAAVQPAARRTCRRSLRLPGHGAGADRAEGGVLARPDRDRARKWGRESFFEDTPIRFSNLVGSVLEK